MKFEGEPLLRAVEESVTQLISFRAPVRVGVSPTPSLKVGDGPSSSLGIPECVWSNREVPPGMCGSSWEGVGVR